MLMKLSNFVENAYVHLVSGLILLGSASMEIVGSMESGDIGAHHGVAVFGLIQSLKAIPHIVHGTEQVVKIAGR